MSQVHPRRRWPIDLTASPFWPGVVLVSLVLVAYLPAVRCGFVWDDDDWIVQNPMLVDLGGLRQILVQVNTAYQYYPLVWSSFWIERHLWGLNPTGYHILNILLQATAGLLLWRVLALLKLPGAWFAAAVFALHPIQVETVAWVSERKNLLSGAFYLAAASFYLRFAGFSESDGPPAHRTRNYLIAFALFLCALMSKTVACSLPAALLLVLWWKKGRLRWSDIVPTIPFFAAGLTFGLLTAWLEKNYIGAAGNQWSETFPERCLIAGRIVWFYAAKLVWPVDLSFNYVRWHIDASSIWQWLFPFSAVATLLGLWIFRNRIGRGPVVAVLFYVGTLFPALGFFNLYPMRFSFVADHFQYMAGIGLIVLASACFFSDGVRRRMGEWHEVVAAVVLIVLAALTWQQTLIYRNPETLWRDTIAKNPESYLAHHNLAHSLAAAGHTEEAIQHYRRASQLYPDCVTLMNLAGLLYRTGQFTESLTNYRTAFQLPTRPNDTDLLIQGLLNYVDLLFREQSYDEAAAILDRGLQVDTNNPVLWFYMGAALASKSDFQQAIPCYEASLRINPNQPGAECNLGTALAMVGRTTDGVAHCARAVQLAPDNADLHNNFGSLLSSLGRTDEAIEQFKAALRLNPNHVMARKNLDLALKSQPQNKSAPTPTD